MREASHVGGSRAIARRIPRPSLCSGSITLASRSRQRFIANGPGSANKSTGASSVFTSHPQDVFPYTAWWSRCDDVIGSPGVDHPLTITERDDRGFLLLNGRYDHSSGFTEYNNFRTSVMAGTVSHQSVSPPIPSIGARATTLRARTNPSREEVSVPNFVVELKDMPRMIRQLRDLGPLLRNIKRGHHDAAIKAVSGQYLGHEFGWRPLVKDIYDLLSFQEKVDKRIVELNRLYSSKGLKRRLKLFDGSAHRLGGFSNIDSLHGVVLSAKIYQVTRVRSWGTIRYRPTVVPTDLGRQDLARKARRLVHGMDHFGLDGVQAWNLLPFSWLADWFGNFGEWISIHRNDVPAAPTGPCNIMTLTETYDTWIRTDSKTSITGASGTRILRTKERAQSSGTLSVSLPLATARQFSILAALNLQRKR